MNIDSLVMAAEFEEMGDHLFDLGTGWAEKGLALVLLGIVLVKICQKFSMKAGIGALLGLIIATSIYSSREDISGYFSNEISDFGAPLPAPAPLHPGSTTPQHTPAGESA
ncbi:hypothetical protein ACFQ7F_34655 [Streptomyces sp. NPDC056486]|uniref:hypothetical protein n=1 Tax=Streptomyces sp. NPDC056486 TaxID=3345835 RepID=UPI0036C6D08C